jgi:hypothetical protein
VNPGGFIHINEAFFTNFDKILYADRQLSFHISSMAYSDGFFKRSY